MASIATNSTFKRAPHDAEHQFSIISRALIRDESISPNCRWLLIYMLSMKDGWKMKISQIWNHVKAHIGRDQLYKIVDEAIEAGYIKKEDQRVGNLKRGCIYYVSETPIFKKCFRHPDFQDPEIQYTESQEALRNTKSSYKEDKEEEAPPPPPPTFSYKRVKMTVDEYQSLIKDFGETKTAQMLDRLDEYADINPKRFKGYGKHSTVIRKWIREDQEKQTKSPKFGNESNAQYAKDILTIFKGRLEMEIYPDSVGFNNPTGGTIYLKFADPGFKEQLQSRLRKMGFAFEKMP